MDVVVVPDSIEPYIGYKALAVQDGHLYSPARFARWPHRQALESQCEVNNVYPEWKLVPTPAEGWQQRFWVPSSLLREGNTTKIGWPPHEPPAGMTWIPSQPEHSLEGCSCGIYAVDNAKQTQGYLHQGLNRLLCEVALWGEVVLADKGARGQYAYPQKIWAAKPQSELIEDLSTNYGIAVEIVKDLPLKTQSMS